jgi:teichoic acid transport system permease protein
VSAAGTRSPASGSGRDTYGSKIHVYAPHKASLPPLGPYLRELWNRRRFAYELSRTTQKANHFDSPLGALWLVLNPMLLGFVYFLLISVLSGGVGDWPANLGRILIGIFTWYYASNSMNLGSASITAGGKLILNQAFPRALLPLSSVISALLMYLPTIPVYIIYYVIASNFDHYEPPPGDDLPNAAAHHLPGLDNPALLYYPLLIAILTVECYGLAMIFATMTVYFRDTSKFLGYFLRIWLYLTPVLYDVSKLEDHKWVLYLNPLGPIIGSVTRVWVDGVAPGPYMLLAACGWAVVALLFGAYIFISRERDFAVRI